MAQKKLSSDVNTMAIKHKQGYNLAMPNTIEKIHL